MALDFAVLTEDGSSANIVSLGPDQHDELMNLATQLKLSSLLRFEDYFEEIDLTVAELPGLAEELNIVDKSKPTPEIAKFAHDLRGLLSLAARRNQPLIAVPD
jgi:hypothetical protein